MKGYRRVNKHLLAKKLSQKHEQQFCEYLQECLEEWKEKEDDPQPVEDQDYIECCPDDLKKLIKRNKKIWKAHASQYQCLKALDTKCEFYEAGCSELYDKLCRIKKMQVEIALAHIHWAEYCYHECMVSGHEETKELCTDEVCSMVQMFTYEPEILEWVNIITPECFTDCPK